MDEKITLTTSNSGFKFCSPLTRFHPSWIKIGKFIILGGSAGWLVDLVDRMVGLFSLPDFYAKIGPKLTKLALEVVS